MPPSPGKRSCYIKELTPSQKKAITIEEPLNNAMVVVVVWDNAGNKGKGIVFKYDWGKLCKISGLEFSDFGPKGEPANPEFWTSRLKSDLAMVAYLDRPPNFVSIAKKMAVTPEMYVKIISAGNNPYEVIGLTDK